MRRAFLAAKDIVGNGFSDEGAVGNDREPKAVCLSLLELEGAGDFLGRVTFEQFARPSQLTLLSPMVRQQSSAAGVLALLQEPDPVFKQHALKALNPLVPQFWAEISEHIGEM